MDLGPRYQSQWRTNSVEALLLSTALQSSQEVLSVYVSTSWKNKMRRQQHLRTSRQSVRSEMTAMQHAKVKMLHEEPRDYHTRHLSASGLKINTDGTPQQQLQLLLPLSSWDPSQHLPSVCLSVSIRVDWLSCRHDGLGAGDQQAGRPLAPSQLSPSGTGAPACRKHIQCSLYFKSNLIYCNHLALYKIWTGPKRRAKTKHL